MGNSTKTCPIELEIKLHTIPKEHDCPKIRNAIQRCHYRKTNARGQTDSRQEEIDKWQERAESAESELADAQAEIERLKAKRKKKKKSPGSPQ